MNKIERVMKKAEIGIINMMAFKHNETHLIDSDNEFFKYGLEKHNNFYRVLIKYPYTKRTTGEKSQNHAINGFCQQISNFSGMPFELVKITAKIRAVKRGYPYETLEKPGLYNKAMRLLYEGWPESTIKPLSETKINTVEAGYLIDELKEIASFLGIILVRSKKYE